MACALKNDHHPLIISCSYPDRRCIKHGDSLSAEPRNGLREDHHLSHCFTPSPSVHPHLVSVHASQIPPRGQWQRHFWRKRQRQQCTHTHNYFCRCMDRSLITVSELGLNNSLGTRPICELMFYLLWLMCLAPPSPAQTDSSRPGLARSQPFV